MHFSYFLWSISHPGKSGTPTIDLSKDEDAKVEHYLPPKDVAIEQVITKTLNHYSIPLEILDSTRKLFKTKLWRIANTLLKMGGFKRMEKLQKWKDEYCQLEVDISEVKQNE